MKVLLATFLIFSGVLSSQAQGIYDKLSGKGSKPNVEFYAYESASNAITSIAPGVSDFYVKVPLRAKDFKFPLGKSAAYADWEQVEVKTVVKGLKNGYSVSDELIYYEYIKLPSTLSQIANSDGEMMIHFQMKNDDNFQNNVNDVLESGAGVYDLQVYVGDGDEPFGFGIIKWDLSDGGASYAEADLASRANYTFEGTDDVTDPAFKAAVKADVENKMNVKIYHMAHGDRVPYSRGTNYYRRNQIGITYKDLESGKCYTGGISAFEDGSGPNGPYSYDMEGQLSQGSEIPCDRVDK